MISLISSGVRSSTAVSSRSIGLGDLGMIISACNEAACISVVVPQTTSLTPSAIEEFESDEWVLPDNICIEHAHGTAVHRYCLQSYNLCQCGTLKLCSRLTLRRQQSHDPSMLSLALLHLSHDHFQHFATKFHEFVREKHGHPSTQVSHISPVMSRDLPHKYHLERVRQQSLPESCSHVFRDQRS